MSELPEVIGGEVITSAFTNQVAARTAQRYASAAARDASIPVPVEGQVAWLEDTNRLTIRTGALWQHVGPRLLFRGNVNTDAQGDFTVTTGWSPTFAACFGTQPSFPTVFALAQIDSAQIKFRAWRLDSPGNVLPNVTIGVTYAVWD